MPDQSQISAITGVAEVSTSLSAVSSQTVVVEAAIAASLISSQTVIAEISPDQPRLVVPNVAGRINTSVTFDGSASSAAKFLWEWVSVPADSSLRTSASAAVLYPDGGASTPIDMTDNGALFHFNNSNADSSGNGRTATLQSISYTTGFDGTPNGSIKFNADTARALVSPTMSFAGDWTVAFWFYNLKPNTDWRTGLRGSTGDYQIIVENGSDRLGVYANNNGNFRPCGFNMPSAAYRGWHHIAAVGSGTTTAFYVDGVSVGSSDRKSSTQLYAIGNGSWTGAHQIFAERIDEFAAWTRALSASEIADIHSKQSKQSLVSFAGLGLSYNANATLYPDNGATTPVDMSNNGALFHFNNSAADTSGNNNSLTTFATSFAEGFDGTANGSLSLLTHSEVVLSSPISMAGDWTFAFWFFNLRPNTAWRTGLRGLNTDHPIIVENGGTRLGVYANGNGDFRPCGFNMPFDDYQGWHHIVVVGSGSTTSFYVNGVSVGSSDRKSADSVSYIGNYAGVQPFAERIDEFAAWTRALSATEITNIYNLQSAGAGTVSSSAAFTPDVGGTYTARLTGTKGAYTDIALATATITEGSSGLARRALGSNTVNATTLAYTALRPGALLPGSK